MARAVGPSVTTSSTDFSFQNLVFFLDLFEISVKKSFNIQELLHGNSKCHGTKPMHRSSPRPFQRHQEHNLKHPGSVDLITTKQNKLPSLPNLVSCFLWTHHDYFFSKLKNCSVNSTIIVLFLGISCQISISQNWKIISIKNK